MFNLLIIILMSHVKRYFVISTPLFAVRVSRREFETVIINFKDSFSISPFIETESCFNPILGVTVITKTLRYTKSLDLLSLPL